MKIQFTESDIEKTIRNEYDELESILKENSQAFRQVAKLVKQNTNQQLSKIGLMSLSRLEDESECNTPEQYFLAKVCGGLNGPGEWLDYLADITALFQYLEGLGFDAWMVKLDNDCLDDIFYLTIGFRETVDRLEKANQA